jgi:hypothetical protein
VASNRNILLAAAALLGAAAAAQNSTPAKYKVVEVPSAARVKKPEFRVAQAKGATTVSIFAGEKPTGGYSVEVTGVDRRGGTCTVRYKIEPPPADAMVTQALTYPSTAIRITPTCREVKLDPRCRASLQNNRRHFVILIKSIMNRRQFLAGTAALLSTRGASGAQPPPNIVVILADDVGYGDLSCYGATRVQTPNLDRLAARGIRFTDAHSSAATCTPSRYSLMTGEYAFRNPGANILPGDASLIIEPERTTIASHLRSAGYKTGYVGKWHLGLGNERHARLERRHQTRPARTRLRLFVPHPRNGRSRALRVRGESSRGGLNPKDPIRSTTATRSVTGRPDASIPNISKCR